MVSFLVGLGLLAVTLLPLLSQQAHDLISNVPTWEQSANQQVQALHDGLQRLGIPVDLTGVTANLSGQLSRQLQALGARLPGWVEGLIGGVFEFFLVVVVMVYLLLKGDGLWNGLISWLPLKLGTRLKSTVPRSFRNYFIGQGTIALMLGTVLAIAFTLFRIPYGFLFGVCIGTLALFPYGGTIGITLVTLLLALKSIGLGLTLLTIATLVDQVIENGIAPRLMGHLTGVHPVWVVMAILIGAKTAGLLGVLLAVPIASTVKEVTESYKPKRIATLIYLNQPTPQLDKAELRISYGAIAPIFVSVTLPDDIHCPVGLQRRSGSGRVGKRTTNTEIIKLHRTIGSNS